MTTPPATALRGLVDFAHEAVNRGALVKWGYTRANVCVDWKCRICGTLYSKPDALPLMNMRASLPADMHCDRPTCLSVIARASLAAWESRGAMALDPALDSLVYDEMTAEDGATLGERIRRLLVSLDRALTGERGP